MTFATPSLSLSGKEASATTLYEPDGAITEPRGLWTGFRLRVRSAVRSVQYARMVQALSELSDEHLAAAGLTRADIPRRAHECVYDTHF